MNRTSSLGKTNIAGRRLLRGLALLLISSGLLLPVCYAGAGFPQVVFILDGSGSMWGDAGGQTKIEAAKEVMAEVVPGLPPEVKVGLAAYGHRRKGDCADMEILIPPGSADREGLLSKVKGLSPKGKTPIADSITMVANSLKEMEDETTIVLVSDGEETCHTDPCGAVKSLKTSGIKFILHVVGFGVDAKEKEQLTCLAEAGGGQYFGASNAALLLSALETVREDIVQKVEKAKTTTKKAATKLGKLRITMPQASTVSLNTFKILRVSDGKLIKTIQDPGADATHALLSGSYEVLAGFANSNYQPDSEVSFGIWELQGGETTDMPLGAMAINIADSLKGIPAGAVIITKAGDDTFSLVTPYTGNDYYLYKTKPLPSGTYHLAVHYKRMYLYQTGETPVILASNVQVTERQEGVVTIDSGIVLKKAQDSTATAWELRTADKGEAIMRIERASNGDHPLWAPYAVQPGTYDLLVFLAGMTEPLPVGEGLRISKGGLLEFDTGL